VRHESLLARMLEVFLLPMPGHSHERCSGQARKPPHLTGRTVTVHGARQTDVHQDHVRAEGGGQFEGFLAGKRGLTSVAPQVQQGAISPMRANIAVFCVFPGRLFGKWPVSRC
jgi:hypothetical protein